MTCQVLVRFWVGDDPLAHLCAVVQQDEERRQRPCTRSTWCVGSTPLLAELQKSQPERAAELASSCFFGDHTHFTREWAKSSRW